jgi:hypothetical protein
MYVIFFDSFHFLKIQFLKLDSSHSYLVPTSIYPCQATVLYDFEAANEDEMSVRQGDTVFIEAKPEHEGWLVAKGRERSGLVPESYVQFIAPPEHGLFFLISSSVSIFSLCSTSQNFWR